jgi:hypothetical protein
VITRPRGTTRLALGLLVVVTACWCGSLSLYLTARDPFLGYMSDPEFGRQVAFVVLPGLGWLITALMWVGTRLARSSAVTWILWSICLPIIAAMFWLPLSAVAWHI